MSLGNVRLQFFPGSILSVQLLEMISTNYLVMTEMAPSQPLLDIPVAMVLLSAIGASLEEVFLPGDIPPRREELLVI